MKTAIEKIESAMLKNEQSFIPVSHLFAPGIYWREVLIPAGVVAIGHEHKTEHLNVLLRGRVRLLTDGKVIEMVAPQVFVSKPGVRKVVYAVEDTSWANVHANPTDERDMVQLEIINIKKSESFLKHADEIKLLTGEGK